MVLVINQRRIENCIRLHTGRIPCTTVVWWIYSLSVSVPVGSGIPQLLILLKVQSIVLKKKINICI